MVVSTSPQHLAVGEVDQNVAIKVPNQGTKQSYASLFSGQKSVKTNSKLDLCPVLIEHGVHTVEFTVDEVNSFTREEGLHQAVILKFSYGKPNLQELRRILPIHFNVKIKCNIGQLEYRHILVRFDLFEDFANVVSKSSGYIKFKGDEFFFRTFLWTMDFNPREETSKAVTWISLPELPANFFAKKSLMSIASVAGKPIAIDKATQDRTRPGTARVKILVNLTDRLPQKTKLRIVDKITGRIVEFDQRIVFDNLPKYCICCNHQGHDIASCRRNSEELSDRLGRAAEPHYHAMLGRLKGDAREFLNDKITRRQVERAQPTQADTNLPVSDMLNHNAALMCKVPTSEITKEVTAQPKNKDSFENDIADGCGITQINNTNDIPAEVIHAPDQQLSDPAYANKKHQSCVVSSRNQLTVPSGDAKSRSLKDHQVKDLDEGCTDHFNSKLVEADPKVQVISTVNDGNLTSINPIVMDEHSRERDRKHSKKIAMQQRSVVSTNSAESCPEVKDASDCVNKNKNTVSLTPICMMDFHLSKANSKFEIGSVSGVKQVCEQQNMELEQLTQNPFLASDDTGLPAKDVKQVEMQTVAECEDCTKIHATAPLTLSAADNANIDHSHTQMSESVSVHLLSEKGVDSDMQHGKNQQNSKCSEMLSSSHSFVALANIDKQEDKMMGGVIKKIQSYTPISISSVYSGEDLNDSDEFSSLEGKNKQLIVANMRDMVIKSKLWDQQHFEDDESLDEGSGGWSSAEERHQDECNSPEEDSDDTTKSMVLKKNAERSGIVKQSYSGRKLNHNAQVFIPKKESTTDFLKTKPSATADGKENPPMSPMNGLPTENTLVAYLKSPQNQLIANQALISPDKFLLQNEMKGHLTFEEGAEEDILAHCRNNAARMGDLSPRLIRKIKKNHQKETIWDGKKADAPIIRKLPMRFAKQKNINHTISAKSSKSKSKP